MSSTRAEVEVEVDLWADLGVSRSAGADEVDRAYLATLGAVDGVDATAGAARRLAWKVLRDPFYGPGYAAIGSLDRLLDAGFFDDGLDPEDLHAERIDHRWLTTPVHKLRRAAGAAGDRDRPAVLLTTGGFSPVHDAHLEMMEVARTTLEAAGRMVVGGYLSPSHDSYVSTKDAGRAGRHAEHRLLLCEEAVRDSDWLMVDPWEARSTGVAINYTDVLARLEAYLSAHARFGATPIEVVYVFGGDNAGFARTFSARGTCVCVPRPGCEAEVDAVATELGIAGHGRIHFASRPTAAAAEPTISISSSAIRAGRQAQVPAGVGALLAAWDTDDGRDRAAAAASVFAVRDDLAWATGPWRDRVDPEALAEATARWRDDVFDALAAALAGTPTRIECYNIGPQVAHVLEREAAGPVLSLDPCTAGAVAVGPARLFAISDGQRHASDTVARPGWPPLVEQFAAIPAGDYTLVDDDVATGATMAAVRAAVAPAVHIIEVVSLLDWSRARAGTAAEPLRDFVDLRDFLVGARDSGLVVELPDGSIGRAPYLLPYVSPASRMSLPPPGAVEFSIRVWRANARLFESLPCVLRLRDADPSLTGLWRTIGFTDDLTLAEACAWHATRLVDLPFSRSSSPGPRR